MAKLSRRNFFLLPAALTFPPTTMGADGEDADAVNIAYEIQTGAPMFYGGTGSVPTFGAAIGSLYQGPDGLYLRDNTGWVRV